MTTPEEKAAASVATWTWTPAPETGTGELDKKEPIKEKKSEPKAKKEKKEPKQKASKVKTVRLELDWMVEDYPIDGSLPAGFMKSKLRDDQTYVPIHIYRDIMRQIGEFDIPVFSEPTMFIEGKNKQGVPMITYKSGCTVTWTVWKEVKVLRGSWYAPMSGGVLLSDAVHGNMKTLEARALRDALKYAYKIFEFPELDKIDAPLAAEVNLPSNNKLDEVAKDTTPVNWKKASEKVPSKTEKIPVQKHDLENDTPVGDQNPNPDLIVPEDWDPVDNEEAIRADYAAMKAELDEGLKSIGQSVTKAMILDIATKLKEKFGEAEKDSIKSIIMPDYNSAE